MWKVVGKHDILGLSSIRHPLPGNPAEVGQALVCVRAALDHGSPLFTQSHLEAFFDAPVLL